MIFIQNLFQWRHCVIEIWKCLKQNIAYYAVLVHQSLLKNIWWATMSVHSQNFSVNKRSWGFGSSTRHWLLGHLSFNGLGCFLFHIKIFTPPLVIIIMLMYIYFCHVFLSFCILGTLCLVIFSDLWADGFFLVSYMFIIHSCTSDLSP